MNPAACARAKKAKRLAEEAPGTPLERPKLPATPEEAEALAYKWYRKQTRPFRRVFRGIITRREAERFLKSRLRKEGKL